MRSHWWNCSKMLRNTGLLFIVSIEKYEELSHKPSSFLLVNAANLCDQIYNEGKQLKQNLLSHISIYHVITLHTFLIRGNFLPSTQIPFSTKRIDFFFFTVPSVQCKPIFETMSDRWLTRGTLKAELRGEALITLKDLVGNPEGERERKLAVLNRPCDLLL